MWTLIKAWIFDDREALKSILEYDYYLIVDHKDLITHYMRFSTPTNINT